MDEVPPDGTDAPICQDTRSGSQVCGLARSVVCHHTLKDLAGEKAFETADDLPYGVWCEKAAEARSVLVESPK